MIVLAMAGKMAPRPSSPFSRSVTNLTARSMAARRPDFGSLGSIRDRKLSIPRNSRASAVSSGAECQSTTLSAGTVNSSDIPMPRGLRACGLWAITTSKGTTTVRDQ